MFFYITLIIGLILDIITKNLAYIFLQNKINILGDFVYLEFIKNPGIAFGVKIPTSILKIITIVLIILIFYYYRQEKKNLKNDKKLIDLSFSLILAGAIGNGIERILYSEVVDFIGVKYFSIFNLADSFISIGVIIYLFILYKHKK